MPTTDSSNALNALRVLALGSAVPVRFAAGWLAQTGADVAHFRPHWHPPASGSPEAAFEQQMGMACRTADFSRDAPYDVVLFDTAATALLATEVPAGLVASAATVEVTSPLPAATGFDDALLGDMQLWARSGLGYLTREIGPDWELANPCLPINRQPSILAGIAAATAAVVTALEQRDAGAPPRRIAIDQLELLALMPMQPIAFAQLTGRIVGRERGPSAPGGTMPTANGMAYVRPVEPAHWAGLLRVVGGLDAIADAVEANPGVLWQASAEIDKRIRDWALTLTSEEIADRCQAKHIPVAPVYRPDQVVRDAHLLARGFVHTPPGGGRPRIGLPWRSEIGTATASRAESGAGSRPDKTRPVPAVRPAAATGNALPLAGLRILDLSWAWAGPFAATLLSDLGAEVINVEWHPRASNLRRNAPFAGNRSESHNTAAWWSANQRGKFSIGVDMKTAAGKQLIHDLAAQSDAVVENFAPGVVDRLGVGFADLVKVNPRMVYVSLSAFGQSGPRSHYIGYGTQVYAASGAAYATSQDGRAQSQMFIPYPDPVSGLAGAFAIAAHVRNAHTTGRPSRVDVSELEVVACVAMEPLLAALEGVAASPPPPERRYLVTSTADDRFVALLARRQDDWGAFARALNAPGADDASLGTAAHAFSADDLLRRLAAAGLLATPLHDSAEVLRDPYLADRQFWVADRSPEVAATGTRIGGSIWHVDGARATIWRGAPQLFADTRNVLENAVGYDRAAIEALFASGGVR